MITVINNISIFHEMQKRLAWYCRGFDGARELRAQLMQANNSEEVEKIFSEFRQK